MNIQLSPHQIYPGEKWPD